MNLPTSPMPWAPEVFERALSNFGILAGDHFWARCRYEAANSHTQVAACREVQMVAHVWGAKKDAVGDYIRHLLRAKP